MQPAYSLVGKKFGKLTVLARDTQRGKRSFWAVRCECGNEKIVIGYNLVKGLSKSCGCTKSRMKQKQFVSGFAEILWKYRHQARTRGLEWGLSEETVFKLIALPCHYCGDEPRNTKARWKNKLRYNGIDRKDNNLGYVQDNVVPCCKLCNRFKGTQPYAEFVSYLNRLAEYRIANSR